MGGCTYRYNWNEYESALRYIPAGIKVRATFCSIMDERRTSLLSIAGRRTEGAKCAANPFIDWMGN
jgi:hypothetical protein